MGGGRLSPLAQLGDSLSPFPPLWKALLASRSILTGLFQSTSREAGMIKWIHFYNARPQKCVTAKKSSKIYSRCLTTFDFDREYLRNGSTYQKSEKLLITCNPFHVRRKKLGVFWSTNEKVIDSNKCTP